MRKQEKTSLIPKPKMTVKKKNEKKEVDLKKEIKAMLDEDYFLLNEDQASQILRKAKSIDEAREIAKKLTKRK